MAGDEVEFSAKVPAEEYATFKGRFPQYGAVLWFINTALREFNLQCDAHPDSEELVNRAVNKMLARRRGANI